MARIKIEVYDGMYKKMRKTFTKKERIAWNRLRHKIYCLATWNYRPDEPDFVELSELVSALPVFSADGEVFGYVPPKGGEV